MKKWKILLPALFISTFTYAQQATLKGKVTSENEPVPFANVLLNPVKKGATTDADGNFTLNVDPGTYSLTVSYVGCRPHNEQITLNAGETLTKDIALVKMTLGTVVKTEGKYEKKVEELTVSLDVIRPNIIENKNVTSADQALQQAPGLVIVDSEPQLRGGSGYSFGAGSRVMVLVDDLPLLSGDAGRPSWGFIPVENVEQIEVVKGASSVLYGSAALNGVINVRSAYPTSKPKTKVTFFAGIYDIKKSQRWYDSRSMPYNTGISFLHARRLGKKQEFDLVVGGNLYSENGYVGYGKVPGDSTGYMADLKNREFERRGRINFNFRHRVPKKEGLTWGVNGNLMYSASGSTFIWQGFGADSLYRGMPGTTTRTLQTIFHIDPFITHTNKNGSTQSLRLRYFYLDNNNDNNQGNSSQYIYGEYQYRMVFPKIKDFSITPGIMASYTIGKAQLFAGNQPAIPSGFDSIRTDKIGTYALNSAIYLQVEKKFIDRITISGGFRLEYFQIGKRDQYTFVNSNTQATQPFDTLFKTQNLQPVFRLGTNFRVAKATYIRASFGQGYRFPTIAERFVKTTVGPAQVYPNPDLRPEKSWSAELGLKQGFKVGEFMGYFDVAGFYQRYQNTIEFVAAQWGTFSDPLFGFGFRSVNIGPSQVWGIDASIMGTGQFTKDFGMNVLVGYTYSNPTVLDPDFVYATSNTGAELTNRNTSDTANAKPNEMKYRFRHLVRADLEFNYKKFSFGVSARYNSFMRNVDNIFLVFDDLNVLNGVHESRQWHRKGDYVIDLRAAYQVHQGHRVSLIVNNILNRAYSLRPLSVEAPRQFIVQYQVQF